MSRRSSDMRRRVRPCGAPIVVLLNLPLGEDAAREELVDGDGGRVGLLQPLLLLLLLLRSALPVPALPALPALARIPRFPSPCAADIRVKDPRVGSMVVYVIVWGQTRCNPLRASGAAATPDRSSAAAPKRTADGSSSPHATSRSHSLDLLMLRTARAAHRSPSPHPRRRLPFSPPLPSSSGVSSATR